MPRLESFLSFYCLLLIMGGLGRCWWLFSQKILIFPYNHQWFSYYTERCIFRWTLKLILDSKDIYKNNINSAEELQIFPPPRCQWQIIINKYLPAILLLPLSWLTTFPSEDPGDHLASPRLPLSPAAQPRPGWWHLVPWWSN